ncbi:hypothetical protein [Microbacterium sp. SS28]|uniref:hypothetical protein n=1 Tax=Microbacterium sp. SS28 TaxID=2919948 RepID=UPI001FAA94E0|nr:hypothetical protein [Microbacterium sp. SS28]
MSAEAPAAPRLTMLLPEGWVRLAVSDDPSESVQRILDRALAGVDRARRDMARVTLRRRLQSALGDAAERGVYELWLPIAPTSGVTMPASVAIAALPTQPDPARAVAEVLVGFSASAAGALAVEIGGALGVRIAVDVPERHDAAGELEAPPTRLVNYIVSPARPGGEWLVFTASLMIPDIEQSADVLAALEFVIDSMMATVEFEEAA